MNEEAHDSPLLKRLKAFTVVMVVIWAIVKLAAWIWP